ncbi:hypothetical protein GQX74_003270 [Glossina fuscipes]|nr:hypothetical protein GQX74_003270 [Glossina fuscipes]
MSGGFVESVEDFFSVDGVEYVFGDDVVDVEDVEDVEADDVDESEVADEDEDEEDDDDESVNGWGEAAFCGGAEDDSQGDCESSFWGVAEGASDGAHEGAVAFGVVTHGDGSVVILGAGDDES